MTVPIQFNLDDLKMNAVPKMVSDFLNRKSAPKVVVDAPKPKAQPSAPIPSYMTKDEVEAAVKAGKDVEYMGVLPKWQAFTKNDTFVGGFFYRLK